MSEQPENSAARTATTFVLCGTLTAVLSYLILNAWGYGGGEIWTVAVVSGVAAGAALAMQQRSNQNHADDAAGS